MNKRRSAIVLVVVGFLLIGGNIEFTAHYVNSAQSAQQQAGRETLARLCKTLDGLASDKPPPGDPKTNPSRAYDQIQHAQFISLSRDLGCG